MRWLGLWLAVVAFPAAAQSPPPSAATAVQTPPAPTAARALAAEGRRLMNEGRLVDAARNLERALDAGPQADPEWMFDLGHCRERLGRDDQALDAFRKYRVLPLTLRSAEADRRIAAIERRRTPAVTAPLDQPRDPPRYVLVPTKNDGGKCADSCNAPSACGRMTGNQCEVARFSCLRACAGAEVHRGLCAPAPHLPSAACFQDRRPWFGPDWLRQPRF